MGSAAEFLDEVIKTPAFKDAMRALLKAGTWVGREVFDAMEHLPMAMDNALSDLVMLGLATHQPAAGYRLAQPPLLREVGRRLALSGSDKEVLAKLVGDEVQIGIAMRDAAGEVVMAGVHVPVPDGMAPDQVVQWAADSICGTFVAQGVAHV
ncbi:MAG: hypothetical protein JNK17_02245 [Hydrogenophaga sp.]|nr:hypothetical protein [Hydrogenophaga sp.]